MIGIVELIALAIISGAGYFGYENLIKDKLDTPKNSEVVKGLDKSEVKAKIKEDETLKKVKDKEIKDKDKERKDILKGNADDKADQAQAILEAKEELQAEVKELEDNLVDLKAVDKGGYSAYAPKLTLNNGLWLGGSLIGLIVLFKLAVGVIGSAFPKLGREI